MSGTVPPPPPPPPGPAPEPEGAPVSGVPPRVSRVPSAYRMPPSVSPSRSGEVPVQSVPAPGPAPTVALTPASYPTAARYPAAPTTAHAPVPPAPEPVTPTSPSSPAEAPTQAWSAQPAAYPTQAYAPQAYAPRQPAQGDWWGDQWNGAPAQQPQQIPPGGYQPPAHHAYAAAPAATAAAPAVAPAGAGDGTGGTSRRRKGGLTPGWIAFIAVDALLLIVAVVFAVQIFAGGGGAPTDEAEAGAGAGAQATQEAGEDAQGTEDDAAADELPAGEVLAEFASPSRNITCQITTAGASCGIAELDQQPAPVEGCDGTTGYVVAIDGEGRVSLPCVPSSDQPQKAGDGTSVLEYGQSVTEGDYTCSSAETGMSCTYDPSGRGFSLARAGIGTF
ncbi:hypothetical protein [Isoptericola variabilis]|uniref:Uncharacterized protein n=1 Tax=Isoptericola variabilis (strain 225) TaxID=743718 RepID=F6FQH4_ISOV2|nr:hypothetical protein [Isoptericola variabilis]AEG43849.1 hypothetical protein Isova_1067 [Isoptericola variabilis 225]